MRGWLVVRTHSRRELWACENITRQGAEPYLPRLAERTSQGRKRPVTMERLRCLFPGYIFVKPAQGRWRFLLGTFGVLGVIMGTNGPAVVPEQEIASIRAREDADGFVQLPRQVKLQERFERGSMVRVTDGVFSGCKGIYEGSTVDEREQVLLDFLGRKTPVLFGSELVEQV